MRGRGTWKERRGGCGGGGSSSDRMTRNKDIGKARDLQRKLGLSRTGHRYEDFRKRERRRGA